MLLQEGVFDPTEVEFFNREGYIIAENVFEPSDLEPLRGALSDAIAEKIEELRQQGRLTETYADLSFEKRLTRIYRDDAENGAAGCTAPDRRRSVRDDIGQFGGMVLPCTSL